MPHDELCLIAGVILACWYHVRLGHRAREADRRLDEHARRIDAWERETARVRRDVEFQEHYFDARCDDLCETLDRAEGGTRFDPVRDLHCEGYDDHAVN